MPPALACRGGAGSGACGVAYGLERGTFDAALGRIQQAIGAGELPGQLYRALTGTLQGSAAALFAFTARPARRLCSAHRRGGEQVLSVLARTVLTGRTRRAAAIFWPAHEGHSRARRHARGRRRPAAHLRTAPKERAENVMIVDLLRNDLSRIALPHSVQVPALFATQALPTVWQMTSDVRARTRPGTTLTDVFAALFPAAPSPARPRCAPCR